MRPEEMKNSASKSLLVVLLILALSLPLVWARLVAPVPSEWVDVHAGMERSEIHRVAGLPPGGNFEEERLERWAKNSVLVQRKLDVWYQDSAHPTRATEVYVSSYWHF